MSGVVVEVTEQFQSPVLIEANVIDGAVQIEVQKEGPIGPQGPPGDSVVGDFISVDEKGAPEGVATLGVDGIVPDNQLPVPQSLDSVEARITALEQSVMILQAYSQVVLLEAADPDPAPGEYPDGTVILRKAE